MTAAQLLWARSALVFDLDGTLVDTLPDLTHTLNLALTDMGLPTVDAEQVRTSLHGGLESTVTAALQAVLAPAALHGLLLARYRHHYEAAPALRSQPYPGVADLLHELRQHGRRLAVCTNKSQALAQRVLGSLGLAACFSVVVGADTCGHRKPHPAPLLHAVAALGIGPDQSLLVGDSGVDLACAKAAGLDCLLFAGGYGPCPHRHSFSDWSQLMPGGDLRLKPLPQAAA